MPLAISVGYGVILPVASPSNAILYTSGYLTIKDMVIYSFS
jgi:di/tricarboxylate transporter